MSTSTGSLPGRVRKIDEDLTSLAVSVQEVQRVQRTHGEKLNRLQSDVDVIKSDVAGLKTDMVELKTDMVELKTDMVELKSDVAGFKTDVMEKLGVIISRLPER